MCQKRGAWVLERGAWVRERGAGAGTRRVGAGRAATGRMGGGSSARAGSVERDQVADLGR
jgi:hypothetical protein